jgi:thioredoxin 2
MIRVCPSCGSKNRVPASKLDRSPRCGRCHVELGPLGEPVAIDSAPDFDELVGGSPLPVLVDFWADWCQPCRMVAPQIEKLAQQQAGRAVVAKLDTERVPEIAARYGVRSIPTMVLFRHGQEAARTSGAMPAPEIARRVGLAD